MSAAITFQVASDASSACFSQRSWVGPEERRVRPWGCLIVFRIRAAVAAHVEPEHLERRAIAEGAIDPPALERMLADRHVIEERLRGPRRQQVDALDLVGGLLGVAREVLVREPVVQDLVVVPLREHRHLRVEPPEVGVHQVVRVVAAELGQGLGDLGGRLGGQVLPHRAVGQRLLGRERAIGIDRVAGMDEEGGLDLTHRLVDLHAAPVGVDAPALPPGIARPDEADVPAPGRRHPEAAGDRLAHELGVGEVDEAQPVEDALAGRQAGEVELGGEVGILERRRTRQRARVGKALRGRPLDQQARRPVGLGPEDRAIAQEIPALHAGRQRRPHLVARDHRGGGRSSESARRHQRAREQPAARQRRALQEGPPREGRGGGPDQSHGCAPQGASADGDS